MNELATKRLRIHQLTEAVRSNVTRRPIQVESTPREEARIAQQQAKSRSTQSDQEETAERPRKEDITVKQAPVYCPAIASEAPKGPKFKAPPTAKSTVTVISPPPPPPPNTTTGK